MPKVNVDIVDLIALQELSEAVGAVGADYLYFGKDGELLGRKIKISDVGNIIATQLGAAMNRPDRVYKPFSTMPDGSSLSGTNTIIDPYLNGLEYNVHRRGTELMVKGDEWQNDIVGGGIRLTIPGDEFVLGDIITVSFQPQISGVISTPDAVARFTLGEQEITADTVAGPANDRKLIMIQGATSAAVSYTLNSTYPENVLCPIVTGGGLNKQSIILAPAGQQITQGTVLSRLVLGEVDFVFFVRIGNYWRVVNRGDRWKRVGQVVYGGIPGPDTISANGQTLLAADYPGIDDYLTALEAALPGSVVTVSQWNSPDNANKGKWARDATSIRVPKLQGRFIRGLDLGAGFDPGRSGSNASKGVIAGDLEAMDLQAHAHGYKKGKLQANPDGGGIADYVGQEDGQTDSTGGVETRPTNIGLPVLICI